MVTDNLSDDDIPDFALGVLKKKRKKKHLCVIASYSSITDILSDGDIPDFALGV